MKKWYNIELEKKYNELFEKGLKLNNVYYEKSFYIFKIFLFFYPS